VDLVAAMRMFVMVIEGNSLTAAATRLNTSRAAVSRQVLALEDHFGARLLHRTTRHLSPTEAGLSLFERAKSILAEVAEAEATVGNLALQPTGLLRISAPMSFGTRLLAPLLGAFRSRYPQLNIDIELTDRMIDLADTGVDIAIRVIREPNPHLIARRIAVIPLVVCAAPSYLAQRGTPSAPTDLREHDTLGFSYLTTGDTWVFVAPDGDDLAVRTTPWLHGNNGDFLAGLAAAGGGITLQPDFIVRHHIAAGRLVPLLDPWRPKHLTLHAVYLSRAFLSAKVRVFIDFLVSKSGPWHGTPLIGIEDPGARANPG